MPGTIEQKSQSAGTPANLTLRDAGRLPVEQIERQLCTDSGNGLTVETAQQRIVAEGANRLSEFKSRSITEIFIAQFKSSVVVLLLVAALISACSHEWMQMAGILAAVVINAVIGFFTEYRAMLSLKALAELSGPLARVRRGGMELELPASELVRGDVILLDAGARLPADVRLFQAASLAIDESILTGESVPVYKSVNSTTSTADDATCASDIKDTGEPDIESTANLAYQGTVVVSGRGRGFVISTGDSTRLGHLSQKLGTIAQTATPLEVSLDKLGSSLTIMTVAICVVLFIAGCLQHRDLFQMMQISISLAVAAIPEGLPVVATLALALGTQRMIKLHALIRKLSAVETLGCTEIICTDKTGTLTLNQMSVSDIVIGGRTISVSGSGYAPKGTLTEDGAPVAVSTEPVLSQLLIAVALCNDAKVEKHAGESHWHVHGDPTEGALITAAAKAGFDQSHLKRKYPRLDELPFDMTRKRMTTMHQLDDIGLTAFVKGSPESILSVSTSYLSDEGVRPLSSDMVTYFKNKNQELARSGKRTLAVAMRQMHADGGTLGHHCEQDLIFLGLVAMSDMLKEGVKDAIEECQQAGIRVIMLTGDQVATASAIAKELGISRPGYNLTLTESDFARMNENERSAALSQVSVLARTEPDTKLAIVQRLQAMGKVVAMTGDGVNDASALRQADIGVAMGQSATALAREASDMVITDDSFSTIVQAIAQGRTIYANIARAIAYLLTASLTSVMAVSVLVLTNQAMVLTPLQLLWLNLIMHVFPGLGLVLQKQSDAVMSVPPRKREQKLVGRYQVSQIVLRSLVISLLSFAAAHFYQSLSGNIASSDMALTGTVLLATLSLSLLLQSWSWLWAGNPGQLRLRHVSLAVNWSMLVTTGLGLALLLVAIYFAPLAAVLHTTALGATACGYVTLFALASLAVSILLGLIVDKTNR